MFQAELSGITGLDFRAFPRNWANDASMGLAFYRLPASSIRKKVFGMYRIASHRIGSRSRRGQSGWRSKYPAPYSLAPWAILVVGSNVSV